METSRIFHRQVIDGNNDNDPNDGGGDGDWWYGGTAYAIKWAVIAAILFACCVYLLGGYLHARRRMRKGLPPLAYHRWLVSRRQRMAFAQQHPEHANQFSFYRNRQSPYGYGQAYPMPSYGPPPPAYNEPDYVPAYTPPAANKVDPDQSYSPPPGSPPSNPSAPAARPTDGPSQPPRAHFLG